MFKHPFTMCIAGCTGSGKSEWTHRFLRHMDQLVSGAPLKGLLYCYGEVNEHVLRLQRMESNNNNNEYESASSSSRYGAVVRLCHGAPDEGDVEREALATGGRLLLVLDDLLLGLRSAFLDTVFTRGSHNWGVSVLLITQHLFTRELRIARNNCHYVVLMRNPAGALQVRNLGTQLFPGGALRHFLEAYEDATAEPFGYLLIDMHPTTEQPLRLKTHIYPDELCVPSKQQRPKGKKQATTRLASTLSPAAKTLPPVFSEHIKRHTGFFQQLRACRSQNRYRALIANANSEQLLCLVECALNILRSRVPIPGRHLHQLKRQAASVRQLSKLRSRRGVRQHLLRKPPVSQQSGRGLPALVGVLASVIVPALLQRALDNKQQPATET
uniref:Uncharacterized protein n=1 Tax=Globodera pallida TaxID=36090 RepID=A0A183BNZ8_GLOPA